MKDAAWLKHYIASALKVQGDALVGASTALGVGEPLALSDMSIGTKDESTVSDTESSQGGVIIGRHFF